MIILPRFSFREITYILSFDPIYPDNGLIVEYHEFQNERRDAF